MPTETFPSLPPFPDTVPTAPLLRISLLKLVAGDEDEEERVWQACCQLGFFYLDLRSSESSNGANGVSYGNGVNGNGINGHANVDIKAEKNGINGLSGTELLRDADELFKVGEELFELPVEEKQKYDLADQGSYFGYKGYGKGVVDAKGNKDRNEFYNVSKDDILSISEPLPSPALLSKYRSLLKSYITSSHTLTHLILHLINSRLHLPPQTLQNLHRLHAASGDQVRFVKAPPQSPTDRRTALGAHTDFGSVTVLFNKVGGLMVRLPKGVDAVLPSSSSSPEEESMASEEEGEEWVYVKPLPGHCIINLGDALVKFSSSILRSNIHRVVSPPGAQAETTRYSLVYFSRPEDEVLLRPLVESPDVRERVEEERRRTGVNGVEEKVMSSKEWVLKRALGRRGVGRFEDSQGTEAVRG